MLHGWFFCLTSASNWLPVQCLRKKQLLDVKQVFHFVMRILFLSAYLILFSLCLYTQVLEGVIKYRWNALPVEQRDGMKNFISDVIVQVPATFGGRRKLSLVKLTLLF